ncbi:hypothetical protein EJ03DRAFT_356308 [Teratosphaeria nubilosa]|uniref:Uncharacterized protein n=1 Tax=Teratosphaeria nubilosa TaxID=161662 RepID=A0A6G1KUP5_9PEZI|nr:hypothetical protein EJ03DRAFT_356308 [Teratosphaeria nubilosa]
MNPPTSRTTRNKRLDSDPNCEQRALRSAKKKREEAEKAAAAAAAAASVAAIANDETAKIREGIERLLKKLREAHYYIDELQEENAALRAALRMSEAGERDEEKEEERMGEEEKGTEA